MSDKKKISTKPVLKICVFLFILLPLPLFWGIVLNAYKYTTNPNVAWVSWYNDPYQRVYIGWETTEEQNFTIHYGPHPDSLDSFVMELTSKRYHIVNLTELQADTKYYYTISNEDGMYTKGEFRTAPDEIKPFRFALTADTQPKMGSGWHSQIARAIGENDYAFVALVGDFMEDGIAAEWYDYFKRANAYLQTTPLVPVHGNHERPRDFSNNGTFTYNFHQYFPQSEDNITQSNPYDNYKQFYFSFNWSNIHFQILHFPEVDIDDENEPGMLNQKDYYSTFTQDQLDWIKNDLAAAQSCAFRITLFHCPITGAGFYGPNYILQNELLPILHEYNVSVTVHGHAHHYGRGILSNPIHPGNDLLYLSVGTGGGLADVGLRPQPEHQAVAGSPCYTEGYATEDQLTFTTFTPNGKIIDQYTINASKIVGGTIK
jgi:hypothetical protein